MSQQPEQPATSPLLTEERDQTASNVPIDSKQTLDAGDMNLYASSKTLALGFADIPLLVTNINQIIKAAVLINKFSSVIITLAALSRTISYFCHFGYPVVPTLTWNRW